MRIERYVFGNVHRYTTLAKSPGVTIEQCRALETLAFNVGQSNDPRFAKSLGSKPAFFTCELPNASRCLVRLVVGQPDDAGRPTLRMIGAILQRIEWDNELCGDLRFLLEQENLWRWEGASKMDAVNANSATPSSSIPAKVAARLLPLISEVESATSRRQRTIISTDEFGAAELALVEMLIPQESRARFNVACRMLSAQFPATVVAIPPEISQDAITFRSGGAQGLLSPYAIHLVKSGFLTGALPLEQTMTYRGFGRENIPSDVTQYSVPPQSAPSGRSRIILVAITAMATFSILCCLICYLAARSQARSEIQDLNSKLQDQIAGLDGRLKDAQSAVSRHEDDIKAMQKSRDEPNAPIIAHLATLDNDAGQINVLRSRLKDMIEPATQKSTTRLDDLQSNLKQLQQLTSDSEEKLKVMEATNRDSTTRLDDVVNDVKKRLDDVVNDVKKLQQLTSRPNAKQPGPSPKDGTQ